MSKNKKILITAAAVITLALVVSLTFVSAATPDMNALKTWNAQGQIVQKIDNQTIKHYPASFSLTIQPTATNGTSKLFEVTGGTLTLNGTTYTITSGNGALLPGRHAILLKAEGVNADGQTVTLKLAARYVWQWGNNFNVNIAAKAQIGEDTYGLLMRTLIRPSA
ncbi:MAG: hypothetical protein NWF01_06750 [Candidatus Bathyarchaeota archaeon]|nr:hypothetical protein [Candidatus Bathyarchaeota archaeon]